MRTLMYAGKPLSDFHVVWDGSKEFDKPKKIANTYTIPYRNGNLIKSTESFENVSISYPCFIRENFEENYSELVNYLNSFDTYQRLESTEEPSIYRMAFLHSVITPKTSAFNQGGMFTITFDCMPQEWLKSGENEMSIDMQTTTYTDPVEVDIEYDDALVDNAVLTLSPVQDLNGQEYPWVDKVGRNKLNLVNMAKTETVNGITFTLTDEGKIYMNGTQDGSTTVTMWFPFASIETIPYGTYKISGLPSNMTFGDYGFSTIDSDQHITEHYENNSEVTDTIINFGVWVYEGVTVNNVELKPMIRESTDTSDVWQPYEHTTNICPIYPANGKNLLNATGTNTYCTLENGIYTLDSRPSSNQNFVINTVSLLPGEYIISGGYDNNFRININIGGTYYTSKDDEVTFHVDTSGNYTVQCTILTAATAGMQIKPMIRLSSESRDFVPYQSVAVQQTGKNLIPLPYRSVTPNTVYGVTFTVNADGSVTCVGTPTRTAYFWLYGSTDATPLPWIKPNTKYTVSCGNGAFNRNPRIQMNFYGSPTISRTETTFVTPSDFSAYTGFALVIMATANVAINTTIYPQLELGDTPTAFDSSRPNTYYSNLGQFVYGGTVDLVTGVLTVTMDIVDLGTLKYEYNGTRFKALGGQIPITNKPTRLKGICENYATFNGSVASAPDGTIIFSDSSTEFYIKDSNYTSVESFKTAMNGVMMCYDLASPQTYYLSAQDVALLQGKNYFTAEQPLSVTITEGTTLTNPSYMKARPIIKLNNTGTGTVKLNGDVVVRVTEAPSNVPIYIDCENMNCYSYDEDGNVVNENGNVTLPEGYIEMEKGNNRFTATGQLEPTMIPRWWRL